MKIKKYLFGVLLTCFATLSWAELMNQAQFTEYYAEKAKTEYQDSTVNIVAPLQIDIQKNDRNSAKTTSFLDQAYKQYQLEPEQLDDIVSNFMKALNKIQQQKALNQSSISSILIAVKPFEYLDHIEMQLNQVNVPKKVSLLYKTINPELIAVYVFDTPEGIRFLTDKDLKDLNINQAKLDHAAMENLRHYYQAHPLNIVQLKDTGLSKIFLISIDEVYEASTILLPENFSKKNFDVKGDLVIFIPARNAVMVVGSEDQEGLLLAQKLTNMSFLDMSYRISPKAFIFKNGKLQAFEWK